MEFPTIISYSNSGYSDFAKIMLFNLNNTIKSHKIHFYCLDQEMFVELTSWIPQLTNITITFELVNISNISKNFEQYGSQSYNTITHTKMNILKNALRTFILLIVMLFVLKNQLVRIMKNINLLMLYFNTMPECIPLQNYTHQHCIIYGVALETQRFGIHRKLIDY